MEQMKAVTLYQPWASAIAYGLKRLETRPWPLYESMLNRWLLIHAGKKFDRRLKEMCGHWPYQEVIAEMGYTVSTLPLGMAVARVKVVKCLPTGSIDELSILRDYSDSRWEYDLGDYSPGRFAWLMSDIQLPQKNFELSGFQKVWTADLPEEAQNDDFWIPFQAGMKAKVYVQGALF